MTWKRCGIALIACSAIALATGGLTGTARGGCAPWDGPAVTLEFDPVGGVSYAVSVYRAFSALPGQTITFERNDIRTGSARRCVSTTCASPDRVQISFAPVTSANTLEGTLRVLVAGRWVAHSFRAVWNALPAMCG